MPKALILREFRDYGDLSALDLEEIDMPVPEGHEILIEVEAFALNYGDFELFSGDYTFTLDLPARVGDECAGRVLAIGPDVDNFKPGDRVSTMPIMYGKNGVNGEVSLYDSRFCAPVPDGISSIEACTIWVAYFTAYTALIELSNIQADDVILITAGSSTAGVAAMELARMVGATTIATTRGSNKRDYLLELGYDHVIAQDSDDMSAVINKVSGGKGARIIYDPIGGQIVQDYKDALAMNAMIFLYGGIDQSETVIPETEMTRANAIIRPFSVFHFIVDDALRERGIRYINKILDAGQIKLRVGPIYDLKDWRRALDDQFNTSSRRGKMVIRVK